MGYSLEEIKDILDKAENAAGLKEWYYPEAIAKILYNILEQTQIKKKKQRGASHG